MIVIRGLLGGGGTSPHGYASGIASIYLIVVVSQGAYLFQVVVSFEAVLHAYVCNTFDSAHSGA